MLSGDLIYIIPYGSNGPHASSCSRPCNPAAGARPVLNVQFSCSRREPIHVLNVQFLNRLMEKRSEECNKLVQGISSEMGGSTTEDTRGREITSPQVGIPARQGGVHPRRRLATLLSRAKPWRSLHLTLAALWQTLLSPSLRSPKVSSGLELDGSDGHGYTHEREREREA
jgi:hypothetical protein